MKHLLLIVFSTFLSSCTFLTLMVLKAKKPEVESLEKIKENAQENGVLEEGLYVLKEEDVLPNMFDELNEVFLFDKNGIAIDLRLVGTDAECSGNVLGLVQGLGKESFAVRDSSLTLNDELNKAIHIDNKKSPVVDSKADYYAILYWNSFSGWRQNKDKIKTIKEYISKNESVDIQLILVNEDFIEGPNWEEKITEYKMALQQPTPK
ncbi:MAG: hypothetical protein WED33_03945 [Bacteroidia bacterium]